MSEVDQKAPLKEGDKFAFNWGAVATVKALTPHTVTFICSAHCLGHVVPRFVLAADRSFYILSRAGQAAS